MYVEPVIMKFVDEPIKLRQEDYTFPAERTSARCDEKKCKKPRQIHDGDCSKYKWQSRPFQAK
jgi:hypothetical protein